MKKIKTADMGGEISDLGRKTVNFTGKQAVSAPVFRASRETGAGILPSGKRPTQSEQIRAAKQHIQPGLILRQSVADSFPVPEFVFHNRKSVLDLASHFGFHIFDVLVSRGLRYVIKVFHRFT
jgi:hypothetical protein